MALTIGIFGGRNTGKSSLINMLAGQQVAIVSDVAGTTTDPVKKRIELPGIGACTIIDTAGIDDEGALGLERVGKSLAAAEQVDIGILLFCGGVFPDELHRVASGLRSRGVPFIIVHNKTDMAPAPAELVNALAERYGERVLECSAIAPGEASRDAVTEALRTKSRLAVRSRPMMEGLLSEGDTIVLVCPIDSEAPQGRLILPQVMAIRSILDYGGCAVVLQPGQLPGYIENHMEKGGSAVRLVITDSQVFRQVAEVVPESIPLTSFSMLLARSMGRLESFRRGIDAISRLGEGDRILMLESCTHHANCEDIGRVKIPAMLRRRCGCNLDFEMVSGLDPLPGDMSRFALAIQCGGCMITPRQLSNRISQVEEAGIPVVNYGMAIAYLSGIYDRAIAPLIP